MAWLLPLAPTRCPRATINVLGTRPQPHLFEQPVPSQDTTCPQGAVAHPEPFDTETQKRWGDSQRYDRVARHRKKPICIRVWWAAINCLWSKGSEDATPSFAPGSTEALEIETALVGLSVKGLTVQEDCAELVSREVGGYRLWDLGERWHNFVKGVIKGLDFLGIMHHVACRRRSQYVLSAF